MRLREYKASCSLRATASSTALRSSSTICSSGSPGAAFSRAIRAWMRALALSGKRS